MFCPRCQSKLNEDMMYCPECGMKIERCPQCHAPVMTGAKFCSSCGTKLNNGYVPMSEYNTSQEEVKYDDVPHKMNKKTVMITTLIVFFLIVGAYLYVYHGPRVLNHPNSELPVQEMKVESMTDSSSLVGNINQGGEVFQTKDKIYMRDDQGYLVSMDHHLENQQILLKEKCEYIYVVNDKIYYTNSQHFICSVSTDGKDEKVILNKDVYYLNYKDNKLYYQLDDQGKENIYVYDLKTNQQTQLNHRKSYNINVLDDCIYYTSQDGIYKIGLDGQGEEKICEGNVYNLIYQDHKLYYSLNLQIVYYDLNSHESKVLVDEQSQLLNVNQTDIFYYSKSGVKRYNFASKETKVIYAGGVKNAFVVGDKLVINTADSLSNEGYKVITDMDGENQQRIFMKTEGNFV